MPVCQKFSIILLHNKGSKIDTGNKCFNTKWSPKLMTFINEKTFRKFPLIFDIKN